MRASSEILKRAVGAATETVQSIADLDAEVARAAELIADCLTSGNKLLVCGNGGRAADAADFCTELACRFVVDRQHSPAIILPVHDHSLHPTAPHYTPHSLFL